MDTFLHLFAAAYFTPQELSVETQVPLATILKARNGKPIAERDARRLLVAVNKRLSTKYTIADINPALIVWESE